MKRNRKLYLIVFLSLSFYTSSSSLWEGSGNCHRAEPELPWEPTRVTPNTHTLSNWNQLYKTQNFVSERETVQKSFVLGRGQSRGGRHGRTQSNYGQLLDMRVGHAEADSD
jgi:hypothetical protein